jgi:hypothetical protein
MDVLSRFLDQHRASVRSTTLIADRNSGKIIAFPNRQKGVRIENDKLKIATLADIDDPDVCEAYRERARADTDNFVFQSPTNGEDLIAAFANFPDGLALQLLFLRASESMGNHDSKIVDAGSVD